MGLGKLEKRVGFIGAGQMAEALARGFISKGVVKASDMIATDPVKARRDVFESFSVKPVISNAEVQVCTLCVCIPSSRRLGHHMSSQQRWASKLKGAHHHYICRIQVVKEADIIFLAVKPQFVAPVLKEVRQHLTEKHTIVSIAAGKTLASLKVPCSL